MLLDKCGWIALNKPIIYSSNQLNSWLKRVLRAKIGFVGTLDPLASGLLVFALNKTTKRISELHSLPKRYVFAVKHGIKTITGDMEGEIIEYRPIIPSKEAIQLALPNFTGEILQQPPRFSALKVKGKHAYDLARDNVDFTLSTRPIYIHELQLLKYLPNLSIYSAVCGSGTYIRTLAEDIMSSVGVVGCCSSIIRTHIGPFSLQQANNFHNTKTTLKPTPEVAPSTEQEISQEIALSRTLNDDALNDKASTSELTSLNIYPEEYMYTSFNLMGNISYT